MLTKQQLHDAIERLPDSEVYAVLRYVEFLTAGYEDEPITDEERSAVAEALAEVDAGAKCYTTEDLNRELGL
jgi:hypothetical protein